jgi:hypothetical protein
VKITLFFVKGGGSMFFRNVCSFLRDFTVSYPRRLVVIFYAMRTVKSQFNSRVHLIRLVLLVMPRPRWPFSLRHSLGILEHWGSRFESRSGVETCSLLSVFLVLVEVPSIRRSLLQGTLPNVKALKYSIINCMLERTRDLSSWYLKLIQLLTKSVFL